MTESDDGFTAYERRMLIIEKLDSRSKSSLISRELLQSVPGYQPAPGQTYTNTERKNAYKRLMDDLKDLRNRGLITMEQLPKSVSDRDDSDQTNPVEEGHSHNKSPKVEQHYRIRYALPRKTDKNRRLRLSAEEHDALARTRRALKPGVPAISPFRADGGQNFNLMDKHGIVVRYLEETGEMLSLSNIKKLFNYRNLQTALELVDQLLEVDHRFDTRIGLELVTTDDDDETPSVIGVRLAFDRGAPSPDWKRTGGGLNPHGRFEYTLAETDERLDLIAAARDQVSLEDWQLLWSAKEKLLEWREILFRLNASMQ